MELILASASPRRRELLSQLELPFQVEASNVREPDSQPGHDAERYALNLASLKARSVQEKHPHSVILAGDTVVSCRGEVLGKPADVTEAAAMLTKLSGTEHRVITALFVSSGQLEFQGAVESKVKMRSITDREIQAYIETGEPMDKAGAYAVQGVGRTLVTEVDGCYNNVLGLPLCLAQDLLRKCGLSPWLASPRPCPHFNH